MNKFVVGLLFLKFLYLTLPDFSDIDEYDKILQEFIDDDLERSKRDTDFSNKKHSSVEKKKKSKIENAEKKQTVSDGEDLDSDLTNYAIPPGSQSRSYGDNSDGGLNLADALEENPYEYSYPNDETGDSNSMGSVDPSNYVDEEMIQPSYMHPLKSENQESHHSMHGLSGLASGALHGLNKVTDFANSLSHNLFGSHHGSGSSKQPNLNDMSGSYGRKNPSYQNPNEQLHGSGYSSSRRPSSSDRYMDSGRVSGLNDLSSGGISRPNAVSGTGSISGSSGISDSGAGWSSGLSSPSSSISDTDAVSGSGGIPSSSSTSGGIPSSSYISGSGGIPSSSSTSGGIPSSSYISGSGGIPSSRYVSGSGDILDSEGLQSLDEFSKSKPYSDLSGLSSSNTPSTASGSSNSPSLSTHVRPSTSLSSMSNQKVTPSPTRVSRPAGSSSPQRIDRVDQVSNPNKGSSSDGLHGTGRVSYPNPIPGSQLNPNTNTGTNRLQAPTNNAQSNLPGVPGYSYRPISATRYQGYTGKYGQNSPNSLASQRPMTPVYYGPATSQTAMSPSRTPIRQGYNYGKTQIHKSYPQQKDNVLTDPDETVVEVVLDCSTCGDNCPESCKKNVPTSLPQNDMSIITKHCCANNMVENPKLCPPCSFIDTSECPAAATEFDKFNEIYYILEVGLKEPYKTEMADKSSPSYQKIRKMCQDFILRVYSDDPYYQETLVNNIKNSKDYSIVSMLVRFTKQNPGNISPLYKAFICKCGCDIFYMDLFFKLQPANTSDIMDFCPSYCFTQSPSECNTMNECQGCCAPNAPMTYILQKVANLPGMMPPMPMMNLGMLNPMMAQSLCPNNCRDACFPMCSQECCLLQTPFKRSVRNKMKLFNGNMNPNINFF